MTGEERRHPDLGSLRRRQLDEESLIESGAEDISSTGEAKADFAKNNKPLPRRSIGKRVGPDMES